MLNRLIHYLTALCFLAMLPGCQSIGNNASFMLKNKKELRAFYEEEITEARGKGNSAKADQRLLEAKTYLPTIYATNIPYTLSDHYDTRKAIPIHRGDPVNIIINKVYLKDNAEWFPADTGEIAVVVSIEDGENKEPNNVLVSYEEGLPDNVFLPISDFLAYHTDGYRDQPIKVTVTVFEFDNMENERYKKILGTAATAGAAVMPAFAPGFSVASKVGNFLIEQNQDDVIAKFSFQVYPWEPAALERTTKSQGVPRISYGQYIVINSSDPVPVVNRDNTIHVGFNLIAYKIAPPDTSAVQVVEANNTLKRWPVEGKPALEGAPLADSYLILTISKAKPPSHGVILDRINTLKKSAAGLPDEGRLTEARAMALIQDLDDVNSAVILSLHTSEFEKHKGAPGSLEKWIDFLDGPKLNELDKRSAAHALARVLPPMTDAFRQAHHVTEENASEPTLVKKWFSSIKSRLVYDPEAGKYACSGKPDCS